jgi:hypothetical protein
MTEPDAYADDPFFEHVFDGIWNACIGRQGNEENYLDGYIEAAIELVDAIIERELFAQRDTLVLPILYNARHAIELALKFATDRLVQENLIKDEGIRRDHNIRAYWERLRKTNLGDEKLKAILTALEQYVDSLCRIDADGQELRYHRNCENARSLADYSTANLKLIQKSLGELQALLRDLKYRSIEFASEWKAGACIARCSRRDLFEIANSMPPRSEWSTQHFEEKKKAIRVRFDLSNRQFSKALDKVQANREMAALVGIETPLLYLTDEDVLHILKQWRLVHPARDENGDEDTGLNFSDLIDLEAMKKWGARFSEAVESIESRISADAIADLEAIFYIERDSEFTEYYERFVDEIRKEHVVANDPKQKIQHLIDKTNLLDCLQRGTAKLGRLRLAEKLKAI